MLEAADPAEEAWNWSDDHTVGFILRRQAHEALIHRVDAELAAGLPSEVDPALATDGVHEVLAVMYGGMPPWGTWEPGEGLLRVDATDTGEEIWLRFGTFSGTSPASGTTYTDEEDFHVVDPPAGDDEPDVVIDGPAAALDLWLWSRGDDTRGLRRRRRGGVRPVPGDHRHADRLRSAQARWTAPVRSAASATAASRAAAASPSLSVRSGGTEPQGVRQGLPALADLVPGVDVEEPDRLEQLTGALAQGCLHVRGGDGGVDHERDVLLGDRVRREGGRPAQVDGTADEQVEVDLRGDRALRQAEGLAHARVHLAGVPDDLSVHGQLGAPAGVPGSQLDRCCRDLEAEGCGNRADRLDGVGPGDGRGLTPPATRDRVARGHHGQVQRLGGQGGVERGELVVGGTPVHGQDRCGSCVARQGDRRGLEDRQVGGAVADVPAGRAQHAGEQGRGHERRPRR